MKLMPFIDAEYPTDASCHHHRTQDAADSEALYKPARGRFSEFVTIITKLKHGKQLYKGLLKRWHPNLAPEP
jgi:hypothetical protein